MEQERRLAEAATVRSQPHRRSFPNGGDTRAESPFGRFCLANNVVKELELSGDLYTKQVRSWRIAMGLNCPFGRSGEPFVLPDDMRDPTALGDKWGRALLAMRSASLDGARAVDLMCGWNEEIADYQHRFALIALEALARHYEAGGRRDNARFGAGVHVWRDAGNVFVVDEEA